MVENRLKKFYYLFKLMEIFIEKKEISVYDDEVRAKLDNCSIKTLERYLKDLESMYDHIITIKRGKKKVWKLIKVSDIIEEFIKNSNDLYTLFELAREFDPTIFKELEQNTLKKLSSNESIFIFKNSIMEEIKEEKTKAIFNDLKQAVRNKEYRDIHYYYDKDIYLKDVKPIKLAFLDNNWYLAAVTKEDKFRFLRLSFIKKVQKRYTQGRFQKANIQPFLDFLKNVQNSMTHFGVPPKTAILQAKPQIAKYFKKGMKPYFPSQQFIKELDDGSVLFSIDYTQNLEILPFIQKWLPNLIILKPLELKNALLDNIYKSIQNYAQS